MGDKPFGEFLIMPKGDCFRMTRTLRKKIINNPQWILDMGIYKREDCKYIFMQAEEVLATSLYLGTDASNQVTTWPPPSWKISRTRPSAASRNSGFVSYRSSSPKPNRVH